MTEVADQRGSDAADGVAPPACSGGSVCPECGTPVAARTLGAPSGWLHWRRVVPLLVVAAAVGVVVVMSAATVRLRVDGTLVTRAISRGEIPTGTAFVLERVTVGDLRRIAAGEDIGGERLSDRLLRIETPWLVHPPGRDRLWVGYSDGGGNRSEDIGYGWPLTCTWAGSWRGYDDAPRGRSARPMPPPVASVGQAFGAAGRENWVIDSNWDRGLLIASRWADGVPETASVNVFALMSMALLPVMAWYSARAVLRLVAGVARAGGRAGRAPRRGRAICVGAVLLCALGLAVCTLARPWHRVSAWPDSAAGLPGRDRALVQPARTPLDDATIRRLSRQPDGERELAKELLRCGVPLNGDLVLSAWFVQETDNKTEHAYIGWPVPLWETNWVEREYALATAVWPAGPWAVQFRDNWLMVAPARREGQDHLWALIVYVPSVGAVVLSVWGLWMMARGVCLVRARRHVKRRVERGLCAACGYEVAGLHATAEAGWDPP